MNSTVAEAPRPARDQMDGRSPGSRVSATCRLPDLSLADRNQWHRASARRLQLRGQPWVCFERVAALDAYHIPSSLSRLREAIKGGSTTLCPRVVNGDPTTAGLWSLTAARGLHYCRCPPYALLCSGCQVLDQLHWVGE